MLRTIIALASAAFAITAFATAASARETLTLLKRCPQTGHPACLVTGLRWSSDNALPVEFAPDPDPNGATAVLESGTVAGRLANGPRKRFKLKIEQDEFHIWAAFLGRSKANQPIVLTDRGPFEILAPGIDVIYGGTAAMIDMKTWRFAAEFLNDQDIIVSSPSDVGVWNEAAHVCIAAPTRKPGPLQIAKHGCKVRLQKEPGILTYWSVRTADMRKVFPYVWPLPVRNGEDPIDLAREAWEFGGDGGHHTVMRIKDSDYLIVTMIWDDC